MDQSAKQQAVESIKQATNVLVTVSSNPSVDQLSAALGLTLMLSKLEKHATAVFSGQVPEAIKFLEPDKTLENNVDSLRDFIIALDKEKADKLRYKVEDDVVRIFITPYRTKITKDDFQFSQGDFNVDVVVALGVEEREDLDNSIKAHGRILHDSTVVTVNAGPNTSKLGTTNWSDNAASSLCEMLVSVSESFGSGLLDQQISTAYLTGIVAATERFSNNKTSPKVMTMSAQLMAAGANQQLIANELRLGVNVAKQPENEVKISKNPKVEASEELSNEVDLRSKPSQLPIPPSLPPVPGKMTPPLQPQPRPQPKPSIPTQSEAEQSHKSLKDLEGEIAAISGSVKAPPEPVATTEELSLPSTMPPEPKIIKPTNLPTSPETPGINDVKGQSGALSRETKPTMGGTFNATASDAHDETEKQLRKDSKSEILHHNDKGAAEEANSTAHSAPIQPEHTYLQENEAGAASVDAARDAVNNAVNSQPFNASNNPAANVGSQDLPLEGQSQQINIDDNGMVSMPGAPGQPAEEPDTPTIL